MDRSSYFITDKALFGSFPTQEAVEDLQRAGVRHFINLTHPDEKKIEPYHTDYNYISFPITDHHVPKDWRLFACFLVKVGDIINKLHPGELIYVHCKGGHGRSGIVVASLLCYMYDITASSALEYTAKYHSTRSVMREKWRRMGAPQSLYQRHFVHMFFEPFVFFRSGDITGFSNFSSHPVTVQGLGTFPTAEAALQAYKNPDDVEYVQKQREARTPNVSVLLGKKVTRPDWEHVCERIILHILKSKFDQHPDIRKNLLGTGFRPLIQHTRADDFWGNGGDGSGKNRLGKALMKLREYYYRREIV
jgi:ribA/ribD-fused uncharacterized protein